MSGQHDEFEQQIGNLTDALVNDILAASDEAVLEEGLAPHADAKAAQNHIAKLIEAAHIRAGKIRMENARRASKARQQPPPRIFSLPFEEKTRLVQQVSSADEGWRSTLAARNGKEISEADLDATIQALYELGVIDDNGQVR